MLRLRRCMYALGGLALLSTVRPVAAQTTIGFDVAGFSDYVWRGLTFTNNLVIQPDVWVSFPLGGTALTIGGWANIEPSKYNGSGDISEGGGAAGPDVAEFDWWADLTKTFGTATFTVGATGYIFPNDFGFTSQFNTIEAYVKLVLAVPMISPKINAYYDLDVVKGLYVEGSVSHGFPVAPGFSLTLGALGGLSAGQSCDPNSSGVCQVLGNFFDNGLTHVDLNASGSFAVGPLSVAPQFHFVINHDEFTKTNGDDTKVWFGAVISWSKTTGGSE